MADRSPLSGFCATIRITPDGADRDLAMDMNLKDALSFLHDTARQFGAEVTSPWFYLQFGLILAATGIAFVADRTIRSRISTT